VNTVRSTKVVVYDQISLLNEIYNGVSASLRSQDVVINSTIRYFHAQKTARSTQTNYRGRHNRQDIQDLGRNCVIAPMVFVGIHYFLKFCFSLRLILLVSPRPLNFKWLQKTITIEVYM